MVLLSIEGPTALQFGVQGSMREDAVCKCWALLEQGWKKREGRVGTGTSTKHLRAIGGSAGGGKKPQSVADVSLYHSLRWRSTPQLFFYILILFCL